MMTTKPIFEIMNLNDGANGYGAAYPFSCHMEESRGKPFHIQHHYHKEIELLYFCFGSARVSIGNNTFPVEEGQMLFINSMEVHSITADPGYNASYFVIMSDLSVLSLANNEHFYNRYVLPFVVYDSSLKHLFMADELNGTQIPGLFQTLLTEYKNRKFGFELAIQIGISQIILYILRNCYKKTEYSMLQITKKHAYIFDDLFNYVEKNYPDDISSEVVSNLCHVNYSYFARTFKKITGKTFKKYLNFVRISKAEVLLLSADYSITEVACIVGYTNTSYFIKQFRLYKDLTPGQFRKMLIT